MNNLLETLESMASLDATDNAAVDKMACKAKWKACIISKTEHTLFLIQYLSNNADTIRTNAAEYTDKIQPLIASISAAIRTKDPTQIAQAYATYQPELLTWIIEKKVRGESPRACISARNRV